MKIDFHTHGKLAKKLPFSEEYTKWLLNEAGKSGLDSICLTEHFNTLGFDKIYQYIIENGVREDDSFLLEGIRIFPGMETDIAEGGHILSLGPVEAILELNQKLDPYKEKGKFLPFQKLMDLFEQYPVLVGAAHPFREGSNIPKLKTEELKRLHFLDLNGKDVASECLKFEILTKNLGDKLGKPVVGGSDTHQAVQYGCIYTEFHQSYSKIEDLYQAMRDGLYEINISERASYQVKTAGVLKRALKEIYHLGGDYVSVLTEEGQCACIRECAGV